MPHIHEKIDFTAEVFIVYNNKVLLRKHDKYKIWLSIGGHIELDEDPNQAAIREVKEEVGLEVELYNPHPTSFPVSSGELVPPMFLNRHRINETHEHVTLIYFASSTSDRIIESSTEKTDGWKWFTPEELDDPAYEIKEQIRFYAQKALEILSNS